MDFLVLLSFAEALIPPCTRRRRRQGCPSSPLWTLWIAQQSEISSIALFPLELNVSPIKSSDRPLKEWHVSYLGCPPCQLIGSFTRHVIDLRSRPNLVMLI